MPDLTSQKTLTDSQKKFYLGIFYKMMDALKEHGDRSQESERYRKMLSSVIKDDHDFFDWLWGQV